jgi:hypothetical protein
MARDENDLRIRPGKVRDRSDGRASARRTGGLRRRPASFLGEVQQAIRRAGGQPRGEGREGKRPFQCAGPWRCDSADAEGSERVEPGQMRGAHTGAARGGEGSRREAQPAVRRRPRPAVRQCQGSGRAPALSRTGRRHEGWREVYSAGRDVADGRAFLDRGRDDRHQFRFIVSAEDGTDLADPRRTTAI